MEHPDDIMRLNAPNPVERAIAMRANASQRFMAALGAMTSYRKTELSNYHMLRKLATMGQLEAFVEFCGLDSEHNPCDFDETVAREAPAWINRGGAL